MATDVRDLPRKVLPARLFQLIDRAGTTPQARQDRAKRRVQLVVGLLGLYLVFAYGAAVWTVVNKATLEKYAKGNLLKLTKIETRRGDITDRNGVALATSLSANSVSANPRWVLPPFIKVDKKKVSTTPVQMPFDSAEGIAFRKTITDRIVKLLGVSGKEEAYVREQMNRHDVAKDGKPTDKGVAFVYLAHKLTDKQSQAIREAIADGELPGITLEPRFIRYYPNNELAGPLVGRDNTTGSIEASFDKLLRGQEVEVWSYKDSSATPLYIDGAPDPSIFGGKSVALTIDEKIQAVAEHHLEASVREFEAQHGIAVVMDVQTGDVLALAQWPSFNPNDIETAPKYGLHNIAVEFQYEPGSTFKVFNLAIGLQEKAVTLEEIIPLGPMVVGNKVIKDDHPHAAVSGLQSLQVSSNIANAKIAMRMHREVYEKYLRALGFGRRLDLGMIGEGAGQLSPSEKWSLVQYANIAFGQGIAVTPLQMVAGFAAVANGGTYRRPRLIRAVQTADGKEEKLPTDVGKRVFDKDTTEKVLLAMASVCQPRSADGHSLGGTGTAARLPNYTIGGKTGTAQQANANGGYSDTHWVGSFIGVTPIEKPRLVVFVAIDTPNKFDPKLGKIARYGGIVAAPVVREIVRFTLPYLGVPPSPGAPYLDRNDPEKAKKEDGERKLLAQKTAATMLAATNPQRAVADATPVAEGMARVPDVLRLPMRIVRERLATAKLGLAAGGSGVGVEQVPAAGEIVVAGTPVKVTFKRMSEVADARPPEPPPEEAAKPTDPAKPTDAQKPVNAVRPGGPTQPTVKH